jgi:hypothetical protein
MYESDRRAMLEWSLQLVFGLAFEVPLTVKEILPCSQESALGREATLL